MEIIQKKSGKNNGKRVLSCFVFLFIFSLSTVNQAIAQAADSAKQDTAAGSGMADIKNLTKNFAAANIENKKMLEQQRHDEIMSYIYMGLGFSVVIFIAWFTTSLARKRKIKDDEIKAIRLQNMKPHDHNHHRKGAHPRR